MKNKNINVRATKSDIQRLKQIAKKMKISQGSVVSIALLELEDLLKQYPIVDYNPTLKSFLLRKDPKEE